MTCSNSEARCIARPNWYVIDCASWISSGVNASGCLRLMCRTPRSVSPSTMGRHTHEPVVTFCSWAHFSSVARLSTGTGATSVQAWQRVAVSMPLRFILSSTSSL